MRLKAASLGILIVFLVTLFTLAQSIPTGATVRGRIVYEDTGLPLRRAWVGLIKISSIPGMERIDIDRPEGNYNSANYSSYGSNSGSGEDGDLVLTDENGEYVITDIEPGVYVPFVKQPGIWNPDENEAVRGGFQQVTVIGSAEIEVNLSAKRGGVIEGRIGYQDGSPVPGVLVTIRRTDLDEYEPGTTAVADDRGIYRFAGLAPGEYFVWAAEPVVHSDSEVYYDQDSFSRTSILRVHYPGEYSIEKAVPVAVGLAEERAGVDFTLPNYRLTTLSGVVVSKKDNRPIAGMKVRFEKDDEDADFYTGYDGKEVETDENGNWAFRDLLPGKYTITATMGNYFSRRITSSENETGTEQKYASTEAEVEVVDGPNASLVISMPVAATIEGEIVYETSPSADMVGYFFITATDPVSENRDFTFTSGNDHNKETINPVFSLNDLLPGNYRLTLSSSEGPYIRSIMLGGREITNELIAIKEGESITGVRIVVATDFATLNGKVSNTIVPAKQDVFLVPVERLEKDGIYDSGGDYDTVKPSGTFQFKAKPGTYFLVFKDIPDYPEDADEDEMDRVFREWTAGAETVVLKAGETVEKTVRID